MRSPSLLPTFEALEARTLMAGTPDIGLLQAETGAMVASALSVSFETQEEAFSLQERLNLEVVGGKYYENERGKGEKWLQSRTDRFWYCILPNGEVRKDDGNLSLITTLSPAYHRDPLLLLNAKEPVEEVSSFAVRSSGRTTEDREEEEISSLVSPQLIDEAISLQERLQLEVVNGQYYQNERGKGEKWLQSKVDKFWYCIMPNGEVRKDDGNLSLVTTLSSNYYQDPSLLINARKEVVSVASSNRTYQDLSLSEPSARKGFAGEALNITGLTINASARDLASRISPELFGATSAQDETKLEELALREAGGAWNRDATLAMSRIRGSRNALFSRVAGLAQDAAPTLENAITVAFEEGLSKRLKKPFPFALQDYLRPRNPDIALIRVIPSADELRAKVEANFDRLYDLLLHFTGEETQIHERTERLSQEGILIENPSEAGDTGASTDRNAERALRLALNALQNSSDPRVVALREIQGTQTQVAANLSSLFSETPISDPNGVITGRDLVAGLGNADAENGLHGSAPEDLHFGESLEGFDFSGVRRAIAELFAETAYAEDIDPESTNSVWDAEDSTSYPTQDFEIDAVMGLKIFDALEKQLYEEIRNEVADVLTTIRGSIDIAIAKYQQQIDEKSQRLLLDKNLGAMDKTALGAEIFAAGIVKTELNALKFFVPETPEGLALEVGFSLLGASVLKRVPGILRGAVSKLDDIAGTTLKHTVDTKISNIAINIEKLTSKYSYEIAKYSSKEFVIEGRIYSYHAIQRMTERGITAPEVEYAIRNGLKSLDKIPGRIRFQHSWTDTKGKLHDIFAAIDEATGRVITVLNYNQ